MSSWWHLLYLSIFQKQSSCCYVVACSMTCMPPHTQQHAPQTARDSCTAASVLSGAIKGCRERDHYQQNSSIQGTNGLLLLPYIAGTMQLCFINLHYINPGLQAQPVDKSGTIFKPTSLYSKTLMFLRVKLFSTYIMFGN